jgi:hypothetical protein
VRDELVNFTVTKNNPKSQINIFISFHMLQVVPCNSGGRSSLIWNAFIITKRKEDAESTSALAGDASPWIQIAAYLLSVLMKSYGQACQWGKKCAGPPGRLCKPLAKGQTVVL